MNATASGSTLVRQWSPRRFSFEELFTLFGRDIKDYIDLVPLTPWYRFQFPDGDTFDYGGTPEQTRKEIARFDEWDVQGYEDLLTHSRKLFDARLHRTCRTSPSTT